MKKAEMHVQENLDNITWKTTRGRKNEYNKEGIKEIRDGLKKKKKKTMSHFNGLRIAIELLN